MTQDPSLSADKVAELEHKLADAAAEVAKVQAQLTQAQHAGQPATAQPPPVGQPTSTAAPAGLEGGQIPPVPYGGSDPHVITINGQQVAAGSGQLAAMLQQFMPGVAGVAAAAGAAVPPVVMVNGQMLSGGRPVDLSAYLTPQVTQQIQNSLHQLGLDNRLGAMFGHVAPPGQPPAPAYVAPLAEPPRSVPFAYRLATFNLKGAEPFILLMGFVAPIAVWFFAPQVLPFALVAAVLLVAYFRIRTYVRRISILKRGKVATVTNNETLSQGTYYGGVTYQNMRMRQASGWDATTSWYSGPGYTNKVDYTLDGVPGTLKYRGLLYTDGVILADSRKPTRALCVSQFPYSVKPDANGQFTGELSAWTWGGIIATIVMEATLVFLAVASVLGTYA